MTTYYAKEFVGAKDGTLPPLQMDGRVVHAKKRCIRATKDNTNALVVTDKIYIGQLPVGAIAKSFNAITDTTFGATTISIGTLTTPAKYVNAKTLTATDVPTALGPNAAAAVLDPLTTAEDLYVTLGVGGLTAAIVAAFNTEYTISA